MDQGLRDFQMAGLAAAVAAWDHSLILTTDPTTIPPTTLVLRGVMNEVEVDPQQLQQFGFHVRRVFCLLVNDPTILATVKTGMAGVDMNGEPCKFLHYKRDILGVHLYFGSVNR